MVKVATAREMLRIDSTTINKYGIAGTVLMERAGLGVVRRVNQLFPDQKVLVLCGGGNNGGDGFVAARELHNQGREVEVYMSAKPSALKGDAKVNYDAAKKFGLRISPLQKFVSRRSAPHCLIIDALLGTGLSKEVKEPLARVIRKVNNLSCPVLSIDIPSGISSDSGQVMGSAIKARCTVTFGLPKRGHFLYPGADHTGELYIEEIGFPRILLESDRIKVNLVCKEDAQKLLPSRPFHSHKGTYGHVFFIAGSRGKTGAALLSARACLRSGAGLVTLGVPESLVKSLQSRVTEEMLLPLPDTGKGTLSYEAADMILAFMKTRATVLSVGPGLSTDDKISEIVFQLIRESKIPVVIDADGLNAVASAPEKIKSGRAPLILTPHAGEMARLLKRKAGSGGREIEMARVETAASFAVRTGTCLVLKGAPTVTAAPDGTVYINSTGNPGMATAGTGDVLTGMISALLAQKLSPQHAAVLGVYLHGLAGDAAAQSKGQRSLIASDVIRAIPSVFKALQQNSTAISEI